MIIWLNYSRLINAKLKDYAEVRNSSHKCSEEMFIGFLPTDRKASDLIIVDL